MAKDFLSHPSMSFVTNFFLISRFLRTNIEEAVFLVTLEKGSDVTYTMKFGDENITGDNPRVFSENATRPDPDRTDINIIRHYYWYYSLLACS